MSIRKFRWASVPAVASSLLFMVNPALSDDLYIESQSHSLASDLRASRVGDTVTVVIVESAEASSTVRNLARRSNTMAGQVSASGIDERANFGLNSGFEGQGQSARSESFITQMTARISRVLPNGDIEITGKQFLRINNEATAVEVRGIVRSVDIDADNRVASNRIADAQIKYDGKGFLSRGAKQGILGRLFSLFGLL